VTTLVALAFTIAMSGGASAADRTPRPAVPVDIEVLGDYKVFLVGHAVGTQNYICAATPSGLDWVFIGPQATVYDSNGGQLLTHFHSVNPSKNAIHATWQHSRDTSVVWATRHSGSTDPNYVAPDAIEWLLLDVSGAQLGPGGGDRVAATAFIQRVNTVGGMKPPAAECTPGKITNRKLVPYEADYYFYR